MSGRSSRGSDRYGALIPGLALIGIGVWFLLRTMGFPLPSIGAMWPIFPVLAGLGFFVNWLASPNKREAHGIMIPATITGLVGLFFFAFTLGFVPWSAMGVLWPVFPLIVGIAFFVAWVFSGFREWGLLVPSAVTGAVGIVGLSFTLGGTLFGDLVRFWPLLLIGLGVLVLVGGLTGSGRRGSERRAVEAGTEPEETRAGDEARASEAPLQEAGLESFEAAEESETTQEFKGPQDS
jgi:hypothetical protein